ncbi:MAG: hypothetical protein AAF327_10215 [Cyanobacteria bacterium P01_A01_bin.37]
MNLVIKRLQFLLDALNHAMLCLLRNRERSDWVKAKGEATPDKSPHVRSAPPQ